MPTPTRPRRTGLSSQSRDEIIRVPTRSWKAVIKRVDGLWKPQFAPHHSIVGQNGSGKTHLIVHGLLPLCSDDDVCIIDNKGDDPVLAASGARPVKSLPTRFRRALTNDRPKDGWYRLMVSDDPLKGKVQVAKALQQIYDEGNWIVVLDETRAISDPRSPGLGLQPYLDRLWLRGRSRNISLIASTQAPRWVPSSFYDQCQFVWCSRIRDERAHQRVMEIGSMTRQHIPIISGIRKRRWLYMDDEEDETWLAETGL